MYRSSNQKLHGISSVNKKITGLNQHNFKLKEIHW